MHMVPCGERAETLAAHNGCRETRHCLCLSVQFIPRLPVVSDVPSSIPFRQSSCRSTLERVSDRRSESGCMLRDAHAVFCAAKSCSWHAKASCAAQAESAHEDTVCAECAACCAGTGGAPGGKQHSAAAAHRAAPGSSSGPISDPSSRTCRSRDTRPRPQFHRPIPTPAAAAALSEAGAATAP